MNKKGNLKRAQRAAEKTSLVIVLLALIKGGVGLLTGSAVLISDAFHSASDLISIAASWLGIKISQKKANQRFPFGFYKAENLAALAVSFLIVFLAIEFFKEGIYRLKNPTSLNFPVLAMAMASVGAVVDWLLSRFLKKVSLKTNSPSLKLAAEDKKADIFVSSTVLFSIIFTYLNVSWAEGVVTMIISILLLKVAFENGKESLFVLLDVGPEEEYSQRLANEIEKTSGVEKCLDLKLRRSGPFYFGEVTVGVRRQIDVSRIKLISERIEKTVAGKFTQIESLSVKVEPFKSSFSHLVIPVSEGNGLSSKVAGKFGRAAYFLFVNLSKEKIKGFYFIKNPYQKKTIKAGLAAAKLIVKQKSEIVITKEIGEISFHCLRDNLVDVYQFKDETVDQAINSFLKDKLILSSNPTIKEK